MGGRMGCGTLPLVGAVVALALTCSVALQPLDADIEEHADVTKRVLLTTQNDATPGVPKEVEEKAVAKGAKLMAKMERPYIVKHEEAIAQAKTTKEVEELGERRKAALQRLHKEEQNEAEQAEEQREKESMQAFEHNLAHQKKRSHTAEKALKVELQQIDKKKAAALEAQHSALQKDQSTVV